MSRILTRIFSVLMLTMVSMGAWADVDVQITNDGKFDGGTIKYVGQTKPDEKGFVTVTISVAPDKDYTIKKNNITVVSTYPPSDPNARTRTPEIAENLTLYFKGSADGDTDDLSAEREYTFNVPSGFGAWVKEAEFQTLGKKEPTRATNYKYVIINNKGNKAFNYTIRGDITYSSINKEQLCVHPKAKSVLAENFRFYTTEAAAVADASSGVTGTAGTDYYTEGTTISGITGVTDNTFYVRYSLKDNPAIDINGEKLYKIQARNRKGSLFYIAYQASDKSIRIKSTDGNNDSFIWKLDSGDPYDMYIYNIQGTADHSNGVFTVRDVVNTDGESTLSSIYYDDVITSGYNQSASPMNLQSFILTQGSYEGYQYDNSWNTIWGSSYQIIGAYNSIENKPRDESPKDANYRLPGNMPYYVCVNGSSDSKPGSNGDQLQFYRNWRVEDNTSQNTSQIKFIEVKQTYTFHIIDNSDKEAIFASTASELNAGATITESMIPDILKSPVATNYTFYPTAEDAAAGTNALTRLPYPSDDVYVRYTTSGGSLDLNGGTNYYVATNDHFLYASSASAIGIESPITETGNSRKWKITGNDAYQLTLQNADNSNYVTYNVSSGEAVPTLSASGSKFFLHQSTEGKYELVATTNNDFSTTNYYTLGVSNSTLKLYSKTNYPLGVDVVQTFFTDREPCATPVISFNNSTGEVTISCATDGATIYYTTDGSVPDPTQVDGNNPTKTYNPSSKPIISVTTTIKAIAKKEGLNNSFVTEKTITKLDAPTVAFDDASQSVTIATNSTVEELSMVYTNDGNDPTTGSTAYTAAIPLTATTTVKAMTVKDQYINSDIVSLTVTRLNDPTITHNPETKTITITGGEGETLLYTTDGSDPDHNHVGGDYPTKQYADAFILDDDNKYEIKVIATKNGSLNSSVVEKMIDYRSVVTRPTIIFLGNTVTITADIGDEIYYTYTTNGEEPVDATDASPNHGTTTVTINLGEGVTICKVKAIAKYSGSVSAMASETFDLSGANLSGYYYLQSNGDKAYFMCPSATTKEEGKPYVQTDKSQAIKAVWKLEKVSTDTYRIKHYNYNQYLVATTTKDEITNSVWLETTASPEDNTLFEITETSEGSGIYMIKPKAAANTDGKNYLNVSGGNKDNHTIGLWTAGNNDNNSKWLLLKVPASPTFSVLDIKVTMTAPLGDTYYKVNNVSQNGDVTPDNYDDATKGSSVTLKYGPSYKVWSVAKYKYQSDSDEYWVSEAVSQAVQVALLNPIFSSSGDGVTISNSQASGVTFRYTFSNDGSEPVDPVAPSGAGTDYASVLPLTANARNIFKAIAYNTVDGETYSSDVVTFVVDLRGAEEITSFAGITSVTGNYKFSKTNFSATGTPKINGTGDEIGTSTNPFQGTIDGNFVEITLGNSPLFECVKDATIKNVIISNASVSTSGEAGTIANVAKGNTRIYNCGVFSGTVSGSTKVGGIVGLLDGYSRVINCFSYADITGGSDVGGIVGYNSYESKSGDIRTMVMNCMFYGDIKGGTTISPVYGGKNINNLTHDSNRNSDGLNTYNYYAYDRLKTTAITNNKYNCALAVEEKYLNRFEFYRLLLNSNKKLAAFYATGSVDNANQMAKWVLETADRTIADPKPYPILKAQGYYPSIINPDFENAPDSASVGRNHGGKLGKTLSVTISGVGSNAPTGASISTSSLTLQRTDKDFDRFNFNYDKVQLPYYNDVGTGNYTGNRVVTGWKITAITAINGDPYTASNYPTSGIKDYPDHNYADRKSSNKDLHSVSGRVFSQGAYFDVPYGVTSITIEPYWAKAVYLADANYDVVYKKDYSDKQNVTQTGTQVDLNNTTFDGQKVETSISRALDYIKNNLGGEGSTVYDNALVLVGNLHLNTVPLNGNRPFTMMSVDKDNDHEPDCSLIYHHIGRTNITPIRFDFLNIPGTAQAQKPNGASLICNFTIFKTRGWFEVTNTAIVYSSQVEYENGELGNGVTKIDAPLILLGGIFDQFVSTQSSTVNGKTIYIHVGSNVWINSFGLGTHSDGNKSTPHVPVSVTGGEYEGFYLTGTYNADAAVSTDNAECYISGGHFVEAAGASLEQIDGSVRWQIYNADIDNFFGGGINDAKPITGTITTDIFNSNVTLFCGGPKFGNMQSDKNVTTKAEGCTFGKYFGAGYGGTSLARKKYYDTSTTKWSDWADKYVSDRGKYFDGNTSNAPGDAKYGKKGPGVATDFDYEYFVWSSGTTGGRFFVKFASFSLAQCNDVKSTLKNCTVETNFYGGGNLGKVVGTATSVLEDCTVIGDVYGAGYSASLPTVEVRDAGFTRNPNFNSQSGMFEPGVFSGTTTFTWQNATAAGKTLEDNKSGSANNVLYTNTELTGLGEVAETDLTITGSTTVGGSVYGGGEESNVNGNTNVNICAVQDPSDPTKYSPVNGTPVISGDVFGGGKGVADSFTCAKAMVGVNGENDGTVVITSEDINKGTKVIIGNGTVNGAVYGGGEVGRVEWNTIVKIGLATGTSAPVIKKDVFGAGKGVEQYGYSALVRGNTFVTIQGDAKVGLSVYGGGEIASVGKYNIATAEYASSHPEVEEGEPYSLADSGSGYCNVTIQGNAEIGPDNMKMTSAGGPDDAGHVFGACKGVLPYENEDDFNCQKEGHAGEKHPGRMKPGDIWECYDGNENAYLKFVETLALATQTNVTIDGNAFVKGSVYGGSMNGHVQHDTQVNIKGGQIGCGKNTNNRHVVDYPSVWDENFVLPANVDLECDSWLFEGEHLPYDIYKDSDGDGTPDFATDGHTFYGNVFGGGSGYYPYAQDPNFETKDPETNKSKKDLGYGDGLWHREAGSVGGNTTVNISGGHILTSVYGGNEQTDVGTYVEDEHGVRTVSSEGKCTVNITGGTIGVPRTYEQMRNHPVTCYVFGAGKGDQRINFNTWTNVVSTEVNISGNARIYGSTFGGGEDGHVIGNAVTNIGGTVKIGTTGTSGVDGNIFGGGRGFSETALTAGVVGGNVEVNISGGTMLGSVFGGGRLASVGTYFANAGSDDYGKMQEGDDHGNITINISGGSIGAVDNAGKLVNSNYTIGDVFGGCKGSATNSQFGLSKSTSVTISEPNAEIPTRINRSVFGGGEAGNVLEAVSVTLNDGIVGEDLYGGGALADTNTGSISVDNYEEAAVVAGETVVTGMYTKTGETYTKIDEADKKADEGTTYYTKTTLSDQHAKTTVNLYGGKIMGDAFGGGLGQKTGFNGGTSDIEATTYGDITVTLGKEDKSSATAFNITYENTGERDENNKSIQVVKSGRLFGTNNLNGSPKGNVTVHVYATQNKLTTEIDKKFIREKDCDIEKKEDETPANYVTRLQGILTGKIALAEALNITVSQENKDLCTAENPAVTTLTTAITGITTSIDGKTSEEINGVRYDMAAVYGGGNLADYTTAGKKASVIIHTCEVSVQDVYGGGNAASVPETDVLVKGAYEIEHVFGGGNGKDKFKKGTTWMDNDGADVLGDANTLMIGGYIHEAYGGSNEKGKIHGSVHINSNAKDPDCDCVLELESFYTAGNNADVDGDAIAVVDCMPDKVTPEIYGGAKNANVKGNVELTIRGGTFGKVFGGNNQSGAIFGHIILNIEETNPDCSPIIIDELYGCGNMAAYSVYGYYQDGTDENGYPKYVPRTSANDHVPVTFEGKPHTNPNAVANKYQYDDPVVNIISCTRIGKVFGGGLGLRAVVYGNPTVNINQMKGVWAGKTYGTGDDAFVIDDDLGKIGDVFGGGNEAEVKGNTTVNIGTATTVQHHLSYNKDTGVYTMSEDKVVLGANIIGNVYGGGNKANVTGSTKVNIGKQSTP